MKQQGSACGVVAEVLMSTPCTFCKFYTGPPMVSVQEVQLLLGFTGKESSTPPCLLKPGGEGDCFKHEFSSRLKH